MRKLCIFLFTLVIFNSSLCAKIEALSILTHHCDDKNLREAAKGGLKKIVTEFNGKNMHGYVIELDIDIISQTQLTENLLQYGCYKAKQSREERLEKIFDPEDNPLVEANPLSPEDYLSSAELSEALLQFAPE